MALRSTQNAQQNFFDPVCVLIGDAIAWNWDIINKWPIRTADALTFNIVLQIEATSKRCAIATKTEKTNQKIKDQKEEKEKKRRKGKKGRKGTKASKSPLEMIKRTKIKQN